MRRRPTITALLLAGASTPALATETISYSYDSQGRIVTVVRTGSVNNNVTYNYEFDKADNRKRVKVVNSPNPTPTPAPPP